MLYDVLAHGIGAAVRRLICNCFSSLYAHGDAISIYTRVNVLQSYLASKEGMSRSTAEPVRVGLLDFLAHLHLHYGRMLGNSAPESIGIAMRTVSKSGNQAAVRCAALRLAVAVVRGINPLDRSATAVQADAWTIVQRHAKDKTCEEVRAGCLKLLSAICAAGGGPLWRDGAFGAEEALRACLALTEDTVHAVRDAAFSALGEVAAASRPAAKSEAVTGEKRPAKKAAAERIVSGCVRACLVAPLLDAAVHSKREACLGISRAWMAYIAAVRHQQHNQQQQGSDQTAELLEVAGMLINAVNEAGRLVVDARLQQGPELGGELGSGLAGNELPPLQACALYVLRRGILAALPEAGQRKLLERLASSLDRRLSTPAAVVTLEALAALLEAVGEVTDEIADTLERLLQPHVTSNSAATRQQAAVAMAALAAAHPAAAARMLSGCLDTVASCAAQMGAPLSAARAASATLWAPAPAASAPTAAHVATSAGVVVNGGEPSGGPSADLGKTSQGLPSLGTTSMPVADGHADANAFAGSAAAAAAAAAAAVAPVSPPRPMTPNAGGGDVASSPSAVVRRSVPAQRAVLDTCHGAALSAARLLLTTARAPLGCPARLQRRALALAEDLISGPGPELAGNRAICREVGFLLLGTLCALGVPQATRGSEDMAALWQVALGEAAWTDLDERSLPQRPGVELELAVQLWWRSIALQALSAYLVAVQAGVGAGTAGPTSAMAAAAPARSRSATALQFLASGSVATTSTSFSNSFTEKHTDVAGLPRARSGSTGGAPAAAASSAPATAAGSGLGLEHEWVELCGHLAPLVEPLVELLDSQSYLLEPAKARGGPGGVLAGAAAMFTLSLLELHLRTPGGRISSSSSHALLLAKACLRPFRHGLTPAAADALTRSGLRGLLSPDDAPLGPWPPGLDPLEDALRSFTGGRGAPQLPPWLSAEEYVTLLSGTAPVTGAPPITMGGAGIGALAASAVSGLLPADGDGGAADGLSEGGASGAAAAGTGPALGLGATGTGAEGAGASPSGGLVHATFPQSLGLEAALLTAQLVLLGRYTAASPLPQQLHVFEVIISAVQASKTFARQSRAVAACRRLPLAVAAAVAALAGYGHAAMAARRSKAPLDSTDKVPEKLLQLAQALMPDEEAASLAAAPLSRAAAETYAASAAAGSEGWALRIVRALGSEVAASAAEGREPQQRAVLALALGAAHRARGGLAMQAAVAGSAEALVAAASRPGGAAAAAWVLHGLWLLACSAGGAFVPRVKTSLQLGQELLVSSFESPALRAACARLANASVAALGPEFSLGSLAYVRAKSLVAASGGGSGGGQLVAGGGAADAVARIGGGGGADGGLGLVLFVQQIILFAPHAVPPAKHVPLLLSHLLSSQPDLRGAAALTLRHLAERSAEALRPAEAAPLLFAALDREGDAHIAGQLRATLTTILNASVVSAPSFWLELLSDVVFAAGPPKSAAASDGGGASDGARGGRDGGGFDEYDDDKHGGHGAGLPASEARASGRHGGGRTLRSVREVLTAPHLRTRHYAAECLLRLIRVCVVADPRHRDPAALEWQQQQQLAACRQPSASSGGAGTGGQCGRADLLIVKLQALVDTGFKLATCPLESMRPYGVRMLTLLVQLFGEVPDPLLQGARLMEQYQAQVVSALRSSLGARQAGAGGLPVLCGAAAVAPAAVPAVSSVQHPLLQIAGGMLATCFLESGLAAGDAPVMRRLMELLSAPLSSWHSLSYEPYAEWVGARVRVELLRAHAQCSAIAAAAAARGDALCAGIVAKAQEPHAGRLQALWAALLQDHAMLSSQPEAVLAAYRSPLLEGGAFAPPPPEASAALIAPGEHVGQDNGGGGRSWFGLTPAVAAVLRPVYAAACPAALAALAGRMPSAADLTGPAAAADARAQYRRLLEVGLMLLSDAAARLAHAVQDATRGDGNRTSAASTPAAAAVMDLSQLRDAAGRLAGVLRALQRFLSPEYLTALVGAAPAVGPGADAPAAATASEPLVPTAVLRDLLHSLGAAAFHALLPLHWALLAGAVPSELGLLLTGLALPCCSLLRELCGGAPEQSLAAAVTTAAAACGGGGADSEYDRVEQRQRQSSWGCGAEVSGREAAGDGPRGCGGGGSGGGPGAASASVTAAAVEVVLLLASVCVPYSHAARSSCLGGSDDSSGSPSTSGGGNGGGGSAASVLRSRLRPLFLGCPSAGLAKGGNDSGGEAAVTPDDLLGCGPLPSLGAEAAAGLAQCTVQVLAAAQQLIRRAPWSALAPHVGPLLELPLRLILTSAPGTPSVAAAQRYLETTTAALLARSEAPASAPQAAAAAATTSPNARSTAAAGPSPVAIAAAIVVALADVTELQLRTLKQHQAARVAAGGEQAAGAAAAARLEGRVAALVPALLSCAVTFEAVGLQGPSQPPPVAAAAAVTVGSPSPAPSPSKVGFSSGRGGGGGGAAALHHQRTPRGSFTSSTGGGSGSRGSGVLSPRTSMVMPPAAAVAATSAAQQVAWPVAAAAPQAPPSPGGVSPADSGMLSAGAVRGCVLAALTVALQSAAPAPAALAVLEAVRAAVQDSAAEDAGSARGRWARVLVAELVPPAVERVAAHLAAAKQPPAGAEQSLLAECLKLLVLAATMAGPQGTAAQDGVMQVLVPLLLEAAAPVAGPAAAMPPLRDLAVKLITSLPNAAAGPAFKAQLAAQPPAAKLRLQGALRDAAAAAAAATATAASTAAPGGTAAAPGQGAGLASPAAAVGAGAGAGGSTGRRPAIQLKTTFALPLPGK